MSVDSFHRTLLSERPLVEAAVNCLGQLSECIGRLETAFDGDAEFERLACIRIGLAGSVIHVLPGGGYQ